MSPEKVLDLDGDDTTNFVVLGDRTILVQEDSSVRITGGDGVYTVSNADERFLGMVAGDSVALMQEDGKVLVVKAAKVNRNQVIIYEDEDASFLNVFDAIPGGHPMSAPTVRGETLPFSRPGSVTG